MSNGRWAIELCLRRWAELSSVEKKVYAEWLVGATPPDLHMLLRHVYRDARRRRLSSSQALEAIKKGEPESEG